MSVTLNALRFADKDIGYAVGHGGVVLKSTDAGRTWVRKLDGLQIAQMELESARRHGDAAAIKAAERLVSDGPDKPLLDLLVLDSKRVVAFGAYGLVVATEDGGQNWSSWRNRLDNPKDLHLYAVRRRGDRILIAGEQGLILLSVDAGTTFKRLTAPYAGSFFTAELQDDEAIVVAGLRGNAWHSADSGATWRQIPAAVPATITASVIDPHGQLLFANQAGMLLTDVDGVLVNLSLPPMPPLNFVLPLEGRRLLTLSAQGIRCLDTAPTRKGPAQ